MDRESFHQEDVAELIEKYFVPIRVDKEQFPHIDRLYMDFAKVIMSMQGGWPLNLFLTPDLKPFYAMTYVPPETMKGMLGLKEIGEHIHTLWQGKERDLLEHEAENLVALFRKEDEQPHTKMVTKEEMSQAFARLYEHMDPLFGGLKREPKFPMGYLYTTLLRQSFIHQDARGSFAAELSLTRLSQGGIHDHVGGGFSRYAQDARWEVPHFEKQLIDQAVLLSSYVEAYQMTKRSLYGKIAKKIVEYVLQHLKTDFGLFFAGEDAEAGEKNGSFYVWGLDEVEDLLNPEEFYLASHYFNLTEKGNFFGKNTLHATSEIEEFAKRYQADPIAVETRIETFLQKLGEARKNREKPKKDDQVILAQNALMIVSLLKYSLVFQETEVGMVAKKSLDFLMNQPSLHRSYTKEGGSHQTVFTDYAYLISALLECFTVFHEVKYLKKAIALTEEVEGLFKSPYGGYYLMRDGEDIIYRKCEISDGSEPSGNSVHAENLLRLYSWTRDLKYRERAEDIFRLGFDQVHLLPEGYSYGLGALLRYYEEKAPVMILSTRDEEILKSFADLYLPFSSLIVYSDELTEFLPWVKKMEGEVTLQIFPSEFYKGKEEIYGKTDIRRLQDS